MMTGLKEISGGELRIGGDLVYDVLSKDRDIALGVIEQASFEDVAQRTSPQDAWRPLKA